MPPAEGGAHRKTKPYTPQTNGLVERFNGRVQREVLGITVYSHRDLETLLKGFNQAYNRRRQRVLKGASPEQIVQRRLVAEPKLANSRFKPPDPHASLRLCKSSRLPRRFRIQTLTPLIRPVPATCWGL
jgi:transposase InsO family protein